MRALLQWQGKLSCSFIRNNANGAGAQSSSVNSQDDVCSCLLQEGDMCNSMLGWLGTHVLHPVSVAI